MPSLIRLRQEWHGRWSHWFFGAIATVIALCAGQAVRLVGASDHGDAPPTEPAIDKFVVPPGWTVERIAGPPLINYPLFACFDDQGHLYVAEGTGKNLPGTELEKLNLGKITRLDDDDGDGKFDRSTTYADGLVFPQGVLWHDGVVYVASHPAIWRFEDTDGDGRADSQRELVGKFGFNGNGCDIHGPFLGPDGWLYWTDGRHGYKCATQEGETIEGFAARIFRCRTDGSGIERIAGGGFDNPVELAWTTRGELIGTMDQGPGDCLLHYIEGGVYPRDDQPCMSEFPMTGPPLPPVAMFSAALPVALCGMCRITTDQFGPDLRDRLVTAQFNVHRIQQHSLVRDGSTFRAEQKDFLVSPDYDCHPTDVLEDADGSLLIVDMGAWFNYGCPTSKIAKPEVKGAIYRLRRRDAPKVVDPWGKTLDMASPKVRPTDLVRLLDDPRAPVRNRAIGRLESFGNEAVPALSKLLEDSATPLEVTTETRRNAIWALCRIRTEEARRAVRLALSNQDASVRQVAAHVAGLERDQEALPALARLAGDDEPSIRLQAASSIGRLGIADGVSAILAALRRGGGDRFLDHALTYALIRIGDRGATIDALSDSNPIVRRAALIALDQMPDGRLTRDEVVPLLDTDDPELQRVALDVVSRHEGWAGEINELLRRWLRSKEESLSDTQQKSLTGALVAFATDPNTQNLIAKTLSNESSPLELRLLVTRVIARCRLDRLPDPWVAEMNQVIAHGDERLRAEVIATIRTRGLSDFDGSLAELSRTNGLSDDLRLSALVCIAPRRRIDGASLRFLLNQLEEETEPLRRVTAARAIGACTLDKGEMLDLAPRLERAGPLLVPLLIPVFAKHGEAEVGIALIRALTKSPGTSALTADELRETVRRYPTDVQQAAEPLFSQLTERQREQESYLAAVTQQTLQTPPVSQRGRDVFFSRKVGCYGCHRIDGQGGSIGPDLSQIGRVRDPRSLLEAIVFPSSTIIPDYRQFVIGTKAGVIYTGMIAREDTDAIYLRTAELAEIRVSRSEVADLKESAQSIMPQGLEKTMTSQELSDLLEYLYQRR